jgi:hypothetical protein
MEADANKACELMTEMTELMPQVMKLSMQSAFGTEEEMNEASNELSALESKAEELGKQMEQLKSNHNEEAFQNYLLENCEVAQKLKDLSEAFEGLGELN